MQGVDAEYVNLENVIPSNYILKNGLTQDFYDYLATAFATRLKECGNKIPVVTGEQSPETRIVSERSRANIGMLFLGYFGVVPGSLLAQIGRGYTDLCAALIAVGLDADELQVWKEVDGIFTADPRKVANARLIPVITPEEAAELTYYGSEVC